MDKWDAMNDGPYRAEVHFILNSFFGERNAENKKGQGCLLEDNASYEHPLSLITTYDRAGKYKNLKVLAT
jgi:hypothetical protein